MNESVAVIDEIVCSGSKRSPVWNYFGSMFSNGVKVNEGMNYCKLCFEVNKTTTYNESTSTTTLLNHLRKVHKVELKSEEKAEKKVSEVLDPSYVPKTAAEKKSLLARRSGLCMSTEVKPAAFFASEGFKDFLTQYKIISSDDEAPCAQTISGPALDDLFITVHKRLIDKLSILCRAFRIFEN